MDQQHIEIPSITLEWSEWYHWEQLKKDVRYDTQAVHVPDRSGVYEAKRVGEEERLTIGKASNLHMRVKQGLVKGKLPHSSGENIRASEDTSKVCIRWAVTDRPSAVEEELHKQYVQRFGKLLKYTQRT